MIIKIVMVIIMTTIKLNLDFFLSKTMLEKI